ncbi:NAD(P)H-binding protein [Streptomyces sp. NPDC046887]|uniref:NAD(P)H-binding protein n=1 Tax=Streptomyces sp. NPDC046887 TaxID=3155472 RepID=UPI0033C957C3
MTNLVAGATGTVGRQVVLELLRLGQPVRALTRDPGKADFPEGVEVVRGDLNDPDSLAGPLTGATGLHLITFGDAYFSPLTTGPRILELAREAGVRRITVLHGGGDTPLEQAVREGAGAAGIAWTVAMPVEFMANALEWAEPVRTTGEVREPFTGRLSAMVHEADIGAVIAAALTRDGHDGRSYLITGPQALTVQDKVDLLGAARGRAIGLVELTPEQAEARWRAAGHGQEVIDFLLGVYGDTPAEGRTPNDTVLKVTGRPPRTFARWAAEHAGAFTA